MTSSCQFSSATQLFSGSPIDQARCLLRRVRVGGNVDDPLAQIPDKLASIVGQPVGISRAQLDSYLTFKGIAALDVGGRLAGGVSATPQGNKANYFVIHDTSDEISGNAFPPTIDTAAWSGNDLARRTTSSAHVFINRLGQSVTGHDYAVGWRATKRERDPALKGLFLHHELIQPRIKGGFHFHAVGPQPGFTQATYERLALCYVAAAVRRGQFLVPAFHCVLDIGIDDGHDDPQNFDLFQWGGAIERLLSEIANPLGAHALLVERMAPLAAAAAAPAIAAPAAPAVPQIEVVRNDLSDGRRAAPVKRIVGTKPLFFRAKMAVDADGAARAYHPDPDNPDALDDIGNATRDSKKYIQGRSRNGKLGKGPRPGFFVSATSLQRGDDWDSDAFIDAEFIPYIVLPAPLRDGGQDRRPLHGGEPEEQPHLIGDLRGYQSERRRGLDSRRPQSPSARSVVSDHTAGAGGRRRGRQLRLHRLSRVAFRGTRQRTALAGGQDRRGRGSAVRGVGRHRMSRPYSRERGCSHRDPP